jgi:hypothetical protein
LSPASRVRTSSSETWPESAGAAGRGRSRRRLGSREELGRNDAREVLIEPGQEPGPAAVRLQPQAVELVPEGREAFEQPPLDFSLQLPEALFGLAQILSIMRHERARRRVRPVKPQ